jgi:hypothetical protein
VPHRDVYMLTRNRFSYAYTNDSIDGTRIGMPATSPYVSLVGERHQHRSEVSSRGACSCHTL